jgi:hypothetical protein
VGVESALNSSSFLLNGLQTRRCGTLVHAIAYSYKNAVLAKNAVMSAKIVYQTIWPLSRTCQKAMMTAAEFDRHLGLGMTICLQGRSATRHLSAAQGKKPGFSDSSRDDPKSPGMP